MPLKGRVFIPNYGTGTGRKFLSSSLNTENIFCDEKPVILKFRWCFEEICFLMRFFFWKPGSMLSFQVSIFVLQYSKFFFVTKCNNHKDMGAGFTLQIKFSQKILTFWKILPMIYPQKIMVGFLVYGGFPRVQPNNKMRWLTWFGKHLVYFTHP